MIINPYSFGVAFDPDAQVFITAASLTDNTQKNAINTLVVNCKAAGIWTKMPAIYPLVGGTASTHKWNLKDPRDLDAAYRLVFAGGVTHSSQGIQGNAVNGYANTFLNFNTISTLGGVSTYVLNNITQNSVTIGCQNSGGTATNIIPRFSDSNAYLRVYSPSQTSIPNLNSKGFIALSRINSTQMEVNFNGVNGTYSSNVSGLGTDKSLYLMANHSDIFGINLFSSHQIAFATIHNNMSAGDLSQLYSIIQTYQTTLGRQV
jgi:flagellar basal body rod protein FlgC